MGCKRSVSAFMCAVFLLCLPVLLYAQVPGVDAEPVAQDDADFWFEEGEEGIVFLQVLRWDAVPYCPFYDVVVEQAAEDGSWDLILQDRAETNEYTVSLVAGKYRYRVVVYNLLSRPELESDWFTITVFRAIQPVVDRVTPGAVYLEEVQTGIFTVDGRNFLPETIFAFRSTGTASRYTGTVLELDDRGRRVRIQFPVSSIATGQYVLVAENPGGLTDSSEAIAFRYIKPMDLDVSVGYMPIFVLFDDTIDTYFGSPVVPAGAVAKVTFIPFKQPFGFFGFGLYASASRMDSEFDTYRLSANWLMAHVAFVYQKPLIRQRLILDIHAGPGVMMFQDMNFVFDTGITSPEYSPWSVSALAGSSLHLYVRRRLYVEFSLDCVVGFMEDMRTVSLQPALSLGWQF